MRWGHINQKSSLDKMPSLAEQEAQRSLLIRLVGTRTGRCLQMTVDAILSPTDRLIHYRPSWNPRIWATVVSATSLRAASCSLRDKLEKCSHFQAVQMTFSHNKLNWTLHSKSEARSPVKRYYSIFFICGLWFWWWAHQINTAPVPLQSKISPDFFSVTTRHGWRAVSDGTSL